ncbi:MAG: imidazolonepropionase-like amidohydrolase [Verrucomicrobiales bacterium]|jgi:imidazolonepropionase-like amidohydrolase
MKRLPLAPLLGTVAVALCLGFAVIADENRTSDTTAPAPAAAGQAFVGAKVIPITGDTIENGTLLVKDGKIVAVGKSDEVQIPDGFETIDAEGKVIMPGLICTHSHVGQVSGGDSSAPIQPEVRVIDSINVRDASFERARAGGLTALNIMPGSGHLLSGQTLYVKTRDGGSIEDLAIRNDDGSVAGGIKMANGTNSIRKAPFPGTRAKSAALVREQFVKAQAYKEKLEKAKDDPEKAPTRDLAMEAMVEVLDGKRMIHHHTHRHDDILTVLRLKREFGFRLVLHHVSEAWKVADEIAKANVPCSLILLDSPGGKLEAVDIAWKNGAELEKVGVLTSFHTDDPINDSRWFLRSAAFAVRAGMSRSAALYGMTMAGAKMLDIEQRTGSLAAGKDADFIILSGDPLSVYTRVEQTWVEGTKVFDLSNPDDAIYANGGLGAGMPKVMNMCCFDGPPSLRR